MDDIFTKTLNVKVTFAIVTSAGESTCEYEKEHNEEKTCARFFAATKEIQDDIYVRRDERGLLVRRIVKNVSTAPIRLKELKTVLSGVDFGGERRDDYFYHAENPRIYETMTFPIDYKRTSNDASNSCFDVLASNRWADPGVVQERIGASPYQPFPAILLSNYKKKYGLVHGTLSQSVFYHNYLVRHDEKGIVLEVFSSFKATAERILQANESLVDEWYLGETNDADDVEKIFEKYTSVLREKLPSGYGRSAVNRHGLVWGSWNDGFFRNISHQDLIKEAKALVKYFPTVKWMQIDDGYAVYNTQPHGLGVAYEGEKGIDFQKFPNGLRVFTDEVKQLGLRPAIWIGGCCPTATAIYKEHPEWFIDYTKRMENTSPLDVSQDIVREYMEKALDTLVVDYGFEGVKHDFWSYAFEDSDDLYSVKKYSGYEMREWWLQAIRKRLPKDGYLQTGCDIVQGNPFLGEYFTNYRYGIDVAEANWDNIKVNMQWGAACFATHTGDFIVPNSDAIGIFRSLSDNEFLFLTTYILITRSCVELAGKYSEINEDDWRLKVLQKAACNLNNGQDVYFVDYDYRKRGRDIPKIMYIKSSHFSTEETDVLPRRTVALFNPEDESQEISLDFEKLGLKAQSHICFDVWTGEEIFVKKEHTVSLPPRSCKLLAVSEVGRAKILDTNVKIVGVKYLDNEMVFDIPYGAKVELFCAEEVLELFVNESRMNFVRDGKKISFAIKEKSRIKMILR